MPHDIESDVSVEKLVKDQMTQFAQILQNFGLNLIQSIGEMKHGLGILTEKIDKIENELINLKGLQSQIKGQSASTAKIMDSFEDIKAQINQKSISPSLQSTESLLQMKKSYDSPKSVFEDIENEIKNITTIHEMRAMIKKMKEDLFLLTGGHRILFEIREFDRKLKPNMDLEKEDLKNLLQQKIIEWKSQF